MGPTGYAKTPPSASKGEGTTGAAGSGPAADGMQREEARWSGQAADATQIEEASKPNQPEPIYAHEQWSPTINSPMEKDVLEYVGIKRVEELIGRMQTRKK